MTEGFDRRAALKLGALAAASGLAGCTAAMAEVRGEPEGYVRPDGDPPRVPEPRTCDEDDFDYHWTGFDDGKLSWGNRSGFALRVNDVEFERDEEVHITLANVSPIERPTSTRYEYNLQLYTEEGWQEVRGWPDGSPPRGYKDVVSYHEPGEVYDWTLWLSAEGVVPLTHVHEEHLEVCPDLPAGRYRFAFWLTGDEAVAVAFDLVD